MATFIGTAGTDPGDDLKVGNHKVGIGATTFISPLDFSTDFGNKLLIYPDTADNSYGFGLQFGLFQMFTAAAGNIGFGYGGSGSFTEWMRINSSGNVGIGSTSPAAPLHLQRNTAGGTPWIGQVLIEPAADNHEAAISLKTTETDTDRVWSIVIGTGGGTPNTNFRIYDSTAGADRLNIDNSGYVGIGSTSPSCALDVVGTVKVSGNLLTAGNVGIGSASPSCALDIVGTAKASTAVITPAIKPASDSPTAVQIQNADGTSILNVDTTNVRIGIGTTSPAGKLHVVGDIRADNYLIPDINGASTGMTSPSQGEIQFINDGCESLKINTLRQVGIGTTSPTGKLHLLTVCSGGSGDKTNASDPQLKIEAAASEIAPQFWRISHISADANISGAYNYQTGKNVYWGETTDTGAYYFRGRNLIVESSSVGIGTTSPAEKLDVNGNINSSGNVYAGGYLTVGGSSGPKILSGSGAPSGSQPKGSLYIRTDATTSTTRLYIYTGTAWANFTASA